MRIDLLVFWVSQPDPNPLRDRLGLIDSYLDNRKTRGKSRTQKIEKATNGALARGDAEEWTGSTYTASTDMVDCVERERGVGGEDGEWECAESEEQK